MSNSERQYLVLVEKPSRAVSREEEAALKRISESKGFYTLRLSRDQLKKFWDWFNKEVRGSQS